MKELKFKLLAASVPVNLELPDGTSQTLEIHEMSAAHRDRYLDSLSGRMRMDATGTVAGVAKFDGLQSSLLSLCLYREGKLVEQKEIQTWPASIVSELFEAAQELNRLGKTEQSSSKND